MSIKQRVIEIVNDAIIELGITQNALARKIGANQSTFSQSVNPDSKREPKLPIIIGLMEMDKTINPFWLLLGEGEKRRKPIAEDNYEELYEQQKKLNRALAMIIKEKNEDVYNEIKDLL